MQLHDFERIDRIALGSRWERVRMFVKYATGIMLVYGGAAVIAVVYTVIMSATDDVRLTPLALIVLLAAGAFVFEMCDPYQRITLFGGKVLVCSNEDGTSPEAFIEGRLHDMHSRAVLELGISAAIFGKATTVALAHGKHCREWSVVVREFMYNATDCYGEHVRSEGARSIAKFVGYKSVQEWREADPPEFRATFESS